MAGAAAAAAALSAPHNNIWGWQGNKYKKEKKRKEKKCIFSIIIISHRRRRRRSAFLSPFSHTFSLCDYSIMEMVFRKRAKKKASAPCTNATGKWTQKGARRSFLRNKKWTFLKEGMGAKGENGGGGARVNWESSLL